MRRFGRGAVPSAGWLQPQGVSARQRSVRKFRPLAVRSGRRCSVQDDKESLHQVVGEPQRSRLRNPLRSAGELTAHRHFSANYAISKDYARAFRGQGSDAGLRASQIRSSMCRHAGTPAAWPLPVMGAWDAAGADGRRTTGARRRSFHRIAPGQKGRASVDRPGERPKKCANCGCWGDLLEWRR